MLLLLGILGKRHVSIWEGYCDLESLKTWWGPVVESVQILNTCPDVPLCVLPVFYYVGWTLNGIHHHEIFLDITKGH